MNYKKFLHFFFKFSPNSIVDCSVWNRNFIAFSTIIVIFSAVYVCRYLRCLSPNNTPRSLSCFQSASVLYHDLFATSGEKSKKVEGFTSPLPFPLQIPVKIEMTSFENMFQGFEFFFPRFPLESTFKKPNDIESETYAYKAMFTNPGTKPVIFSLLG